MRDSTMTPTERAGAQTGENLTVKMIIHRFLDANGFDGLHHPALCACTKDNLIPCGEVNSLCTGGYFRQPREGDDAEADFHMGPEKNG